MNLFAPQNTTLVVRAIPGFPIMSYIAVAGVILSVIMVCVIMLSFCIAFRNAGPQRRGHHQSNYTFNKEPIVTTQVHRASHTQLAQQSYHEHNSEPATLEIVRSSAELPVRAQSRSSLKQQQLCSEPPLWHQRPPSQSINGSVTRLENRRSFIPPKSPPTKQRTRESPAAERRSGFFARRQDSIRSRTADPMSTQDGSIERMSVQPLLAQDGKPLSTSVVCIKEELNEMERSMIDTSTSQEDSQLRTATADVQIIPIRSIPIRATPRQSFDSDNDMQNLPEIYVPEFEVGFRVQPVASKKIHLNVDRNQLCNSLLNDLCENFRLNAEQIQQIQFFDTDSILIHFVLINRPYQNWTNWKIVRHLEALRLRSFYSNSTGFFPDIQVQYVKERFRSSVYAEDSLTSHTPPLHSACERGLGINNSPKPKRQQQNPPPLPPHGCPSVRLVAENGSETEELAKEDGGDAMAEICDDDDQITRDSLRSLDEVAEEAQKMEKELLRSSNNGGGYSLDGSSSSLEMLSLTKYALPLDSTCRQLTTPVVLN